MATTLYVAFGIGLLLVNSVAAQIYPQLLYNCAKLPAICNNVAAYYQSGAYNALPAGIAPRNSIVNGVLQNPVILNYSGSGDNARRAVCPDSWKSTHACPEPNQPLTVPQGSSLGHGAFVGQPYLQDQTFADSDDPAFNFIADSSGNPTGMAWSCDEWPPNLSQQGGTDNTRPANLQGLGLPPAGTYCAPILVNCRRAEGADIPFPYSRTEQDFQSSAHSRIATLIGNANVGRQFSFQTFFTDQANAAATIVVVSATAVNNEYQRRDRRRNTDAITKKMRDAELGGRKAYNDTYLVYEHRYSHNDTVVAQRVYFVHPSDHGTAPARAASSETLSPA